MSWLPKYSAGLGGSLGPTAPQLNVYTAGGAIAVGDNLAILNSSSDLPMTLGNGTQDGHELFIIRLSASGGKHSVTGKFNEAAGVLLGDFGSPNGGESFHLIWSSARTSWYRIGIDPGYKIADLSSAVALSGTDLLNVYQAGNDGKVDLTTLVAYFLGKQLAPVGLTGAVTLTTAAHSRRNLYTTGATTLNLTDATTLGDFSAPITVRAGHTVAFSNGPALDLTGASVSSIPASTEAVIKTLGGNIYALIAGAGTGAGSAGILQLTTITGQTPGGTSSASGTYNNGTPATLTATSDGSGLTISSVVITPGGGSGATAFGTFSYSFTTPAVGSHTIITSSTGTYATSSNPYTLVVSSSPLLTTTGVTPTGAALTTLASGTFSNGLPATITATMDGSALSITAGPTITTVTGSGATAAGTWSFNYTNPAAGSHTLVVSSTGTYATSAPGYVYATSNVSLVVNNTSPVPAPSTAFTVNGTYSSSNWSPSALQYSTDSTTGSDGTWTTASVGVSISGGVFGFTHPGLTAGAHKVWVRGSINTGVFASNSTFTIIAAGGSITAPGSSLSNGAAATFTLALTGTGSPTFWASLTIGGVEQTPRTSVAFGATSVNLTPASNGAGTASIYAASSGGSALATSGGFTVSTGVPSYPSLASFVGGTTRPVIYDANVGLQPNSTTGTTLTGWNDALAGSGTNLAASVGVTVGAAVNGLPSIAFPTTQTNAANSGMGVTGGQTWLGNLKSSATVGASWAWALAFQSGTIGATVEMLMDTFKNGSAGGSCQLWFNGTGGHNQFLWHQVADGGTSQDYFFGPAPPASNAVHTICIRETYNGSASWSLDFWVNGTKATTQTVSNATTGGGGNVLDSIVFGQQPGGGVGAKSFKVLEAHPLFNGGATITDANMLLYADNTTGYLRQKWGA